MEASKSWLKFVNRLETHFPLDRPYSIEFVPNMVDLGESEDNGDSFAIRLRLTRLYWMKDILQEEWAHCRVGWSNYHSAHTNKWGMELARIRRKFEELADQDKARKVLTSDK